MDSCYFCGRKTDQLVDGPDLLPMCLTCRFGPLCDACGAPLMDDGTCPECTLAREDEENDAKV